MTVIPYGDLAAQCRDAMTDDRKLEGEIFRTLHASSSPDARWSNDWADEVWHRESDERGAWDSPPRYLGSLDDALAARLIGMKLTGLVERERPDAAGAEWRPCRAELTIETTPTSMVIVIAGEGYTLAGAIMSAVLLMHEHVHQGGRN